MKIATRIFCILISFLSLSSFATARDGDFLLGLKGGLVVLNSSMKDVYNNGFNFAISGESFQSDKFAITGEINYNNFGSKEDLLMDLSGVAKYKSTLHVGSFDMGVKYYTGNYSKSFVAFFGLSLGYHVIVQSFDNQTPGSTADKNKTETILAPYEVVQKYNNFTEKKDGKKNI